MNKRIQKSALNLRFAKTGTSIAKRATKKH